jgi:arylsulfatase
MIFKYFGWAVCLILLTTSSNLVAQDDGSVLPFPPTPLNESVATPRLQDATMKWPAQPQRLRRDVPNILIILLDDIGFGVAETFGGEVHTPTLTKLAHSRRAAHRPQPYPRRLRHDRRAGGRV